MEEASLQILCICHTAGHVANPASYLVHLPLGTIHYHLADIHVHYGASHAPGHNKTHTGHNAQVSERVRER